MATFFGMKAPVPAGPGRFLIDCADLSDYLHKRILVVLQNGTTLMGILRSYDQFNNLVLQEAVERIHVGKHYADIPRGLFMVRGDNLQLFGEIDEEKEARNNLKPIPLHLALAAQREQQEEQEKEEIKRIEGLKHRGFFYPLLREAGIIDSD